MRIHIHAIGTRPPSWVVEGYQEYSKRMPRNCQLELHELSLSKRSKNQTNDRARQQESERLLANIGKRNYIVALDERGDHWSTQQLADKLANWMQQGQDVSLLIGGPDGISQTVLEQASVCWSLSRLTLPHALVRIFLAEQLYRATSLLQNHPYHK